VKFIELPTISSFIILLLISIYLISVWHKRETEFHRYTFSIFIWLTVVVFIILLIRNRNATAYMDFFNIIPPILFMLFLLNIIKDEKDWIAMAFSIVILGALLSFDGYLNVITTNYTVPYLLYPLSYNNTMAALLVLCLFTTIGFYINFDFKGTTDYLIKFVIGFEIFAIFLTASRGGYLVFILASIVFIAIAYKDIKHILSKMWIPLLLAVLFILFLTPKDTMSFILGKTSGAFNFLKTGDEPSLSGRVYMLKVAFLMFLSSPIIGIGLGNFRYKYLFYNHQDMFTRIDPHSWFFKILSETGIVGTVLYFGNVIYFFWISFKKALSFKNDYVYLGLFAGVVGMFAHMCIDVDTYACMFTTLFFVLAILISYKQKDTVSISVNKQKLMKAVTVIIVIVLVFVMLPLSISAIEAMSAEQSFYRGEIASTAKKLTIACKYQKDNDYYRLLLGYIYLLNTSYYEQSIDVAIQYFNQVLNINPLEVRAYAFLGLSYLYKKDDRAFTYLETAHNMYPWDSSLLYWISFAYTYLKKIFQMQRDIISLDCLE